MKSYVSQLIFLSQVIVHFVIIVIGLSLTTLMSVDASDDWITNALEILHLLFIVIL